MSESSWSFVLSEGNSNTVDGSTSLEEFLNSPLLGSESEVSDENSGNIFTTRTLWLVSSSSLSRKLDPDGSAIKGLLIGALLGLSGGSVVVVFNEGFSLVVQELDLGQSSIWLKHTSEGFLSGIKRESLSEELHLSIMLI